MHVCPGAVFVVSLLHEWLFVHAMVPAKPEVTVTHTMCCDLLPLPFYFASLIVHSTGSENGGDGDCQFRAIAFAVLGNSASHRRVREQACAELLRDKAHYAPFCLTPGSFEDYITQMSRQGICVVYVYMRVHVCVRVRVRVRVRMRVRVRV